MAKQKGSSETDVQPGRNREGGPEDLCWGLNAVREALAASPGSISEILIQKGKGGPRLQEIIESGRRAGVRVRFVEQARLGIPRGCKHQGVVARRTEARFVPLHELVEQAAAESGQVLILDSIQDPRNLGSILRSALAAGFRSVILTRERSAPLSGTVARTSAGAVSHLRIAQAVNLAEGLKLLKEHGYWLYGSVVDSEAESIYQTDFSGRIGLVIGSEAKGVRPLVKKQCDHLITIPMRSGFDSLNASVAAAVIMFEIVRRRS